MAMSMKKIGAIAVGGAMVASALATGALAAEKVGDVDAFAANAVTNGNVNVDIVVGSNAAAKDVVSAANIAAKVGSLTFKDGSVTDGNAKVTVSASAKSDNIKDIWAAGNAFADTNEIFVFAAADDDYTGTATGVPSYLLNKTFMDYKMPAAAAQVVDLEDLQTLMAVSDADPSGWDIFGTDNDFEAAEAVAAVIRTQSGANFNADSPDLQVSEDEAFYMSIAFVEDKYGSAFADYARLFPGMRLPFLGQEMVVVKLDTDDDLVILGKEVYDGVIKQGDTYDVGNGYTVKVNNVLKQGAAYKADVQLLKDGKVVASKFDTVDGNGNQIKMVYKDIGIVVNDAWEDIGGNYGFAEMVITKDVVTLELGEEYIKDWEAYAIRTTKDGGLIESDSASSTKDVPVVGIALKYVGDDVDKIRKDKTFSIANYAKLDFDEDSGKMAVQFLMDDAKDVTLSIGQRTSVLNAEIRLRELVANAKQSVPMTAPIAKLDTEASLSAANKNLILVGGPVVNTLAKELADKGLIAIDNASPATLAVAKGAANGKDVLVVAGGDRDKTAAAATALIAML